MIDSRKGATRGCLLYAGGLLFGLVITYLALYLLLAVIERRL